MNKLDAQLISQIDKAVDILKAGGIVAYPTDTVYGLGADAFNVRAVARIYKVKDRSRDMPLPVLLADAEQVVLVAGSVSHYARVLMERFWPGGLTLILFTAASFPGVVTAGKDRVAVRVPDHIVPLTLIRRFGGPIIGTSANMSNKPSPVMAQGVEEQLGGQVELIIDGGRCPGGIESTVVDVTGDVPVVLRRGIVPEGEVVQLYRECNKGGG